MSSPCLLTVLNDHSSRFPRVSWGPMNYFETFPDMFSVRDGGPGEELRKASYLSCSLCITKIIFMLNEEGSRRV